jgi:NitT/TauT family transport system substrate-binding protein
MSDEYIKHNIQSSRRTFLKYAGASVMLSNVLGLVPNAVGGRAYAQSEKSIDDRWLEIAQKYGKPTGEFGKIGDPVILTIGYQPYGTIHWTASLNKQAQLLEKYLPKGSKVVWFRALSGPLINNNMLTGRNQFGYMSDTPALKNGDKIKADFVAASGYDLGEFGSICVPNDFIKNGEVKEPKDLDGKLVATAFGSFSHRQILSFAHEHKIKPILLPQSIDQQMASLRAKSVYAAALWEPYPSWLEQKGIATRWKTGQNMSNTTKQYTPESDIKTFRDVGATLAIHDWMRERPDVMAAYLKAEEECRDMLTNAPDIAAYYIWTDISEVPPEVIRANLDMVVWDGRINDAMRIHLNACAKQWLAEGMLTEVRSQDAEKYVAEWADDRLLQLAMQELETAGQWTSNQLPGFPNPVHPEQMQRQSWEKYKDFRPEPRLWEATKV